VRDEGGGGGGGGKATFGQRIKDKIEHWVHESGCRRKGDDIIIITTTTTTTTTTTIMIQGGEGQVLFDCSWRPIARVPTPPRYVEPGTQ
jgi:hypothetical protein